MRLSSAPGHNLVEIKRMITASGSAGSAGPSFLVVEAGVIEPLVCRPRLAHCPADPRSD